MRINIIWCLRDSNVYHTAWYGLFPKILKLTHCSDHGSETSAQDLKRLVGNNIQEETFFPSLPHPIPQIPTYNDWDTEIRRNSDTTNITNTTQFNQLTK
jgi:hypothetical protein